MCSYHILEKKTLYEVDWLFYYACTLEKKTLYEVDWRFYYACIGQDMQFFLPKIFMNKILSAINEGSQE